MMVLSKYVINDLSVDLLEYPEITIPEQGLKKLNSLNFFFMINDKQALQSSCEPFRQIVMELDASACMLYDISLWKGRET